MIPKTCNSSCLSIFDNVFDNFWYKELELTKSFIESVVSIPSRFVIEFISDEIETNWFWNVFVFNCFIVPKIEIQQPGKSILLNNTLISINVLPFFPKADLIY